MSKFCLSLGVGLATALLAACGSSTTTSVESTSTARGTLVENPPFRIGSVSAAAFAAQLAAQPNGSLLLQIAGQPTCGVDFYYLKFWTVGGAGETTESSGALMVPTGAPPTCSGPRPIVLFAHGVQENQAANIANIEDPTNTEGAVAAATYAAQGYIVVAPNYAGYDISTLGYHPFLNATQQSSEMIDILAAARTALPNTLSSATSDSGKLFIAGHSEGGHVALATLRAMEAAGMKVTAAAPDSGPYALEAYVDAAMFGNVFFGSTSVAPFLTTSYQHEYGNIYSATSDVYSSTYATGIDTLLPSKTPYDTLIATGKLPQSALFDSTTPTVTVPGNPVLSEELTALLAVPSNPANPDTPIFDAGFGNPYLINNAYRVSYALDAASNPDGGLPPPPGVTVPPDAGLAAMAPTQTLRLAVYKNDMRYGNWAPTAPTLLCGGDLDPFVFFFNTQIMAEFWSGLPAGAITVLDLNATPAGASAALQTAFQTAGAQELAYLQTPAGGGLTLAQAELTLLEGYHDSVIPFCAVGAREFFSHF